MVSRLTKLFRSLGIFASGPLLTLKSKYYLLLFNVACRRLHSPFSSKENLTVCLDGLTSTVEVRVLDLSCSNCACRDVTSDVNSSRISCNFATSANTDALSFTEDKNNTVNYVYTNIELLLAKYH